MGLTELIGRAPGEKQSPTAIPGPTSTSCCKRTTSASYWRPSASACATAKVSRVDFSRCAMRTCSSAITSTG